MRRERACRECKAVTTGDKCNVCGSSNLTSQFSGLVIVFDPERSEIAKTLQISKPGKYAIKVE